MSRSGTAPDSQLTLPTAAQSFHWFDDLNRWLTVSSFLAAGQLQRAAMLAQVEQILDAHPDTTGCDTFTLPMRTIVSTYVRK